MRWTRAFADAGFVVTSGLAAGVDAAAHAAALAEPGTIAVTATGPDRCFPAAHRRLQADIALHGAVVTEHPPGTEARPAHFPSRNRIIAGLSLATVVVEAAHRSGALITARLAAETGREVFALPGAPENLKARGCHRLIRDGATLVDEPSQVVDALTASTGEAIGRLRAVLHAPRRPSCADGPAAFACTDAERVWRSLGPEGAHFDELLLRAGLTSATLAPILLAMELEGRLTQQHGVYLPCGSAPPRRAGSQRRR
jgi:DNA processing protein